MRRIDASAPSSCHQSWAAADTPTWPLSLVVRCCIGERSSSIALDHRHALIKRRGISLSICHVEREAAGHNAAPTLASMIKGAGKGMATGAGTLRMDGRLSSLCCAVSVPLARARDAPSGPAGRQASSSPGRI